MENLENRLTFGGALEAMKAGKKVARTGWNGKGIYLYLADGKLLTQEIGDGSYPFTDSIVMKTADNRYCIGWLAPKSAQFICYVLKRIANYLLIV